MTWGEFQALISELDIPAAYDHFEDPQTPPYALFRTIERPDFMADNMHYYPITDGWLELYTDKKSRETERKFEGLLTQNKLYWMFDSENYIPKERVYMTRWVFRIMGGN